MKPSLSTRYGSNVPYPPEICPLLVISVDIVRLNGFAALGSVVLTVIVSWSFGIILASKSPRDAARLIESIFWKYVTFLELPQLPSPKIIVAKTTDKRSFFISANTFSKIGANLLLFFHAYKRYADFLEKKCRSVTERHQ
jgi:hypothetical protein